jgi:hypothetical protein
MLSSVRLLFHVCYTGRNYSTEMYMLQLKCSNHNAFQIYQRSWCMLPACCRFFFVCFLFQVFFFPYFRSFLSPVFQRTAQVCKGREGRGESYFREQNLHYRKHIKNPTSDEKTVRSIGYELFEDLTLPCNLRKGGRGGVQPQRAYCQITKIPTSDAKIILSISYELFFYSSNFLRIFFSKDLMI